MLSSFIFYFFKNHQRLRRGQNYGPSIERVRRSEEGGPLQEPTFHGQGMQPGHSQNFPHTSFAGKSNLADIDVSYLKNVLNAVQNQR